MGNALIKFIVYSWFLNLVFMLFFAGIVILMLTFHDIPAMINSGFVGTTIGFKAFGSMCFFIGITCLVPGLRDIFQIFPWLYPFTMMLMMNLFIVALAEFILEQGFSVISSPRHEITVLLMIIQVIVCRYIMCLYLHKKPMV